MRTEAEFLNMTGGKGQFIVEKSDTFAELGIAKWF